MSLLHCKRYSRNFTGLRELNEIVHVRMWVSLIGLINVKGS